MTVESVEMPPRLEGWITLPEAAEILGVSNQAVHKMTRGRGPLRDAIRRINDPEPGRRLELLVSESAVRVLQARREVAAEEKARESS